jgi:VWFA-related protein
MKRVPLLTLALAVVVGSSLGHPQEPAKTPVFPTRTDLVRLDLVVRDHAGHPVKDLRAGELQVFEDGRACAIESFRLVQAEETVHSGRTPQPPRAAATARASADDEGLVSVVALVFDQLGPEAAKNARAAALELTSRPFPKGSVFAIFRIGQGLSVLQPFTQDRSLLKAAIEKATGGVDTARSRPALQAGYDNATEEAFAVARKALTATGMDAKFLAVEAQMLRFTDRLTRESEGQASLQPLMSIASGLSLVQGRKSLLYFSEGSTSPRALRCPRRSRRCSARR